MKTSRSFCNQSARKKVIQSQLSYSSIPTTSTPTSTTQLSTIYYQLVAKARRETRQIIKADRFPSFSRKELDYIYQVGQGSRRFKQTIGVRLARRERI